MTLPPHVIEAARKAFIEHSGYEMVETDFEASGIGPSIDAAIQAALAAMWSDDMESASVGERSFVAVMECGKPYVTVALRLPSSWLTIDGCTVEATHFIDLSIFPIPPEGEEG